MASNQVQYSLLHRAPERDGVLAAYRELGVTLIAYSPLAQGVLTGKYGPDRPPGDFRRARYGRRFWERVEPVLAALRTVASRRGKTPARVALNWLICKGVIPIPGAKNARQAQENAGALGWRLTDEEVTELERAASAVAPKAWAVS